MTRWLTSLFFLILAAFGVLAGTPFTDGGMNNDDCRIKCCKKKTAEFAAPKQSDVVICRALNCSIPTPTNTNSSSQINFIPNLVLAQTPLLFEILFSKTSKESIQPFYKNQSRLKIFQPKYIRHQSFLI